MTWDWASPSFCKLTATKSLLQPSVEGKFDLLRGRHFQSLATPQLTITLISPSTHARATSAGITVLPSDVALVEKADYILSIVPPRDAVQTANRIIDAWSAASSRAASTPLYFLDLNAIAPSTARSIDAALKSRAPSIRFVDGGIIGSPPKLLDDSQSQPPPDNVDAELDASLSNWKRPSIPVSGPHPLSDATQSGPHLAAVLNIKHLSAEIGPASGLKASYVEHFTSPPPPHSLTHSHPQPPPSSFPSLPHFPPSPSSKS